MEFVAAVLPPLSEAEEDRPYWSPSANGCFTIKSAYQLLSPPATMSNRLPWSFVWKWPGPQRIKAFIWLILSNGVLTNVERVNRHFTNNRMCPICSLHEESTFHLLRDCGETMIFWDRILPPSFRQFFFNSSVTIEEWVLGNLKEQTPWFDSSWTTIFGTGLWLVWKRRNEWVFSGIRQPVSALVNCVLTQAKQTWEAISSSTTNLQRGTSTRPVYWKCPPPDFLKLNCDASVTSNASKAYGGGVIRDSKGGWIGGFVSNIGRSPILRAEIWSILQGLDYAISLGIRKILIESDNKLAVDMIKEEAAITANCTSLVARIKRRLETFEISHIDHIHREGNFVADFLSHHAYSFDPGTHILAQPPDGANIWLFHDLIGVTYVR